MEQEDYEKKCFLSTLIPSILHGASCGCLLVLLNPGHMHPSIIHLRASLPQRSCMHVLSLEALVLQMNQIVYILFTFAWCFTPI
jgi:hypothetical protein